MNEVIFLNGKDILLTALQELTASGTARAGFRPSSRFLAVILLYMSPKSVAVAHHAVFRTKEVRFLLSHPR